MADWWEEYKKKNNLEARADEARKQEAQKQTARQAANDPYVKALQQERDRALLLNKTGDLAGLVKDTLFGTVQTVSAPFGSPMQQASANLNYQANRSAQDMARYKALEQQAYDMAPHNPTARNRELYYAAKAGQQRAAGNYASAYEKYMNASTAAEKSRLDELKQTNKGAYFGETLTADQISGQLRIIDRELKAAQAVNQARLNDPQAMHDLYQATPEDYAENPTKKAKDRVDELEQQKAMYESALRHRTAIDKQAEMQELARSVTGRSDYDRLVRAGREIVLTKNNNARPYGNQYSPDDPDDNRQFARAEQQNLEAMKAAGYVDDLDSSYIPEEVKPVYYALYAGDPAKAKEWAEYWKTIGEDQYWSEIYQQSGADAGSRLKAFIEGTWANTVSGLDPFGEGGQYAAKLGSTMIGGGAAGLTEKGLFNTGFGAGTYHSDLFGDLSLGSAYQLGSSMLQSAANATLAKMTGGLAGVTGGMGTILLGSSAAAQDYQQKIEQGWDEDSAKLHALAAGAAESIFEYVSLDKLVNQDITRGFLRNFLTQGGVEASEEAFTTIANRISDAAISELNGYDNQIQSKAKELMAKGYEKGAAEKMARQEWFTELMSDALGGFVSGGLMSSGQYAMQPIYRAAGAVSEFNDFTRTLSDTGEQGVDSTKDLTKGRVGRLMGRVGANLSAEQIEAARQITGQQGETAENQSKRQQKKQSTRDGAVYEQAVQSIQQQIEQRGVGSASEVYNETVQKYGEAAKEIAQEAIYRSAGQTMSQATDMAELERSANSMAKNAAPEVFEAVRKAKDQRSFDLYRQSGNTEDAERMMQQRTGNQSHGGALNMEAVITRNGAEQKASITGLSKDGKGVVLSDGSTVTAKEFASKDFAADADTKDIVGFLLKSDMGPAAELALQNYITQAKAGRATDGYRYVMDTALAFNQGRRGAISVEQARQRSSLDAETVSNFFALGEETRKSDTAKDQAHVDELLANAAKGVTGRKGSVDTSKVKRKLSDAEAKNLEVATKLAEVLGVDLGIFVSETDAKGRFIGENGRYEDGKIWIDINAGRNSVEDIGSGILACMSHELTHFIQDYAPKAYAELKQFVLRQLTEAKGSAWVDRQIQSKIRRSKGQQLSITAAEDEVVADACQNVLTDSKAIHDYAKRFPQSFSEVLEWIKDFFAKVKEALSSRPMSDEAKVMAQLEAKVRKAFGELWDKGVMEAAEVHSKVGSKQSGTQYSERDYDLPSDLELMDMAAESLSEAGGEEYWKALLENAPELADDRQELRSLMKANREQAKKLAEAEKNLEKAKEQLVAHPERKLNTQGISGMVLNVMKELGAGDAKGKKVSLQVREILTNAYQKALDMIDSGAGAGEAWETVYNDGIVPAAEVLGRQATHSEKIGYKWSVGTLESYAGKEAILDYLSAAVGADFAANRYRDAIPKTAADRIAERAGREAKKKLEEVRGQNRELTTQNEKLSADLEELKRHWNSSAEQVSFLGEQLREARQEMKDSQKLSAKEKRAKLERIGSLEKQLKAKRSEANAWKALAERNERLLQAALKSKNADIDALRVQMDKNASEAKKRQAALVEKLAKQVEHEQKILEGTLKPPAMQRMLKAVREQAAKEAEQHKDEVFARYKDRKQQSDLRRRIRNLSDEMKRRMTSPTDRAYVPASLYESMTRMADLLDDVLSPKPGTKPAARYRATMDAIHKLAREYSAVKDMDDPVYASEYQQEIQDDIGDIERLLERKDATWIDELTGDTKKGFRELSTGELQRLYELLRNINYSMVGATAMLSHSRFKSIFDAMQSVVEQQNSMESLNSLRGVRHWNRMRLLDNLSVMRATEMMSGWDRDAALYQLMHNIEQGADDSWSWRMDYNKRMEPLKTGKNEKEYRNALTKKLDYGVTDKEGLQVLMTKMQALQILMTAEREAHNDKLVHLQTGGAVIRDAIDLQNGKGAKAKSQTIKVTPELLKKIQDGLTDWDRAYMKAVRAYFQTEGKRTNEITYRLKHRVLQTEDYYVPYQVDSNYLETKLTEQQAMNMWVKTPGSTNALKQKAKQPVIIDGMDTVMGQHVKEIGDYIGMAIPIRDFSKVYNGRLATGGDNPLPVKETIDRTFGKKGQHLLTQAVIDVQGGSQGQNWRSGISDFLNKLQGAFVRSALLINPSVTIKQAASYIAAESVLSHRALVAGNRALFAKTDATKSPTLIAYLFANPEGKTAQRIYDEIDKHTSLHYQRRQGMSQAEIANEANRNSRIKRWMNGIGASMEQNKIGHAARKVGESLNPVTWIQRMDVATTATLWVACKEQAKLDGKQAGTEEYWQRTTELYERCLRETQPMYDGLHRTAHQKQAGGLVQFLFPFRTVPIQNHGQIAAAYETLKASKNKSKAQQAEAKKFFAKTVWAQTESAFIFSLMTFIAAALKRKTKKYRDEDEEFTAASFAKGFFTDIGSTLFSVLQPMYGSELASWGGRALDKFEGTSGYSYDAFQVGVVDMLNDLASSSDKLFADVGKLHRGENVSFADIRDHALALLTKGAKLAGIPADTVKTYAEGLIGNVRDIAEGRVPALNDESWERSAAINAGRYLKAWIAGDIDKVDRVEEEMRRNYTDAGKDEEGINEAMKTKLTSTAKDALEDGTLDEQDAIDFLYETGFYTEDSAWKKVQEWAAKLEHKGDEDYSWNQYEEIYAAVDAGEALGEAEKDLLDHGYTQEQITAAAVKRLRERFQNGDASEEETIRGLMRYKGMNENDAWLKAQEWDARADHAEDEDYSWSKYTAIYEAIDENKDLGAAINELTAHGVSEDAIRKQAKSYLIEKYENGGLNETQLRNMLSRYCRITAKKDVDEIVNNANCFRDSGFRYSELKTAYNSGDLSEAKAKQMLTRYGGMSASEAASKVRYWSFQTQHPDAEISQEKLDAYYEKRPAGYNGTMKDAGIPLNTYVSYCEKAAKATGTDADGDGKTDSGSKKAAIMQIINGMNLTNAQKDALYYFNGWAAKTISDAPWH